MKARLIPLLLPFLLLAGCSLPRIAVIKDPLSAEEHLKRAVIAENRGDFDLALREYREAASDLPQARLGIANVYFQTGRIDEAEREYRRILRRSPDNPHALNNLAWLRLTTGGDLDEAEKLASKAVALHPENDEFRDTLEQVRKARRTHRLPE
jgi:tetratricopeptide (TPR) repeat protein